MMDYLDKNLENEKFVKDFKTLHEISTDLNFDIMQALVEELNRYPEDKFSDVLNLMGISINEAGFRVEKEIISVKIDGIEYKDAVGHSDLGGMTPSRLFEGKSYSIYIEPNKTARDFPNIGNWVKAAKWGGEEKEWEDSWHYVKLQYDEKIVKSMGANGYVFAGEVDGHTFEITIVAKETPSYSNYAFAG